MRPLGDTLGHYTIVAHLGTGGMGEVYRATDTRLDRDIALKILPPEVAGVPDRLERFQREARAIAALNHPNIVTIHSVEQIGDVHFLTMELVEGRPLDRAMNGRPLPVPEVTAIARAIVDALAAAHAKGIVHRDLKPANVIVGDAGRVKVLDFGLAKIRTTPSHGPNGRTGNTATSLGTEIGTVLGTPAYMSPEQVSGRDVDHRSDIFSFGIVLYELSTGVRPFRGRSAAELASSILRDQPPPPAGLHAAIPATLSRVITRCLQKDVTARYSSMAEIADVLRSLDPSPHARDSAEASIAVLPFQNLSADPDNEFFGDGLAEEILTALAHVEGLRVAARTSSFSFKGRRTELAEIGAKLHVATVLDGSVRRAGHRLRVSVQLVDVAKGTPIWSERYDREMADIFDVQDEIAQAITEKLKVTLGSGAGARLVKTATGNVEAYELYLRGRAMLLRRGRHVLEAAECFQRATELDPGFAAAWSGLADANTVRGYWGMAPPGETMPKALTAARRAVALAPDLAEAHSALAMALLLWERDYAGAERAFLRCLALNPAYTQGRDWYGQFLLGWAHGRMSEAVEETRKALASDPLSAYATALLAFTLLSDDRATEALAVARRGVELDAGSLLTHWVRGMAAQEQGELEEALASYRRAEEVSNHHPYPIVHTILAFADFNRLDEANADYARLMKVAASGYVGFAELALAASAIGEMDRAIELAHQACDERDPMLLPIARSFPASRRLRADPRFVEIQRRLNLP